MLASTGASSSGRSANTSVLLVAVGLISTASSPPSVPPPSAPPPCRGTRIETSVPRSRPPEIAKLLERAAISDRPSRRLGALTSACGRMPRPCIADDDGEAVGVGVGLDCKWAGLTRIGMGDDVHACLGDDGFEIGDPRLVHPDLLGETGEGVSDHRNVLRFCRKQHLEPPGLFADSRGFGHTAIPA